MGPRVRPDRAGAAPGLARADAPGPRGLPDGRFQGIARDISERRDLETQLRESQKMEALGRLAGGVAHDFNNLLTVMIGHAEDLVKRLDPRDPRIAAAEEIRQAAEHAAALTRRLLAFSRRQVLQPIELDLNDVIDRMDRLLRRVIGEDVTLTTVLDPGTGTIVADPSQIEQVLLNLVVNARDAMPDGGQLTITTGVRMSGPAQTPGASESYAVLRIRDTGVGMDRATRARIFEPFFTTKERGRGIGLGLSTVYGIAQQSGWDIVVDSEPGRGSTFTLYFPRLADRPEAAGAPPAESLESRGETILLVEDDESVRRLARTVLQRHGYAVLEATGTAAAAHLAAHNAGRIALLLTDVVMPDGSGRALAESLQAQEPAIKALLMSGYTDDTALREGVRAARMPFLQKPFTPDALLRKVRAEIDRPRFIRS